MTISGPTDRPKSAAAFNGRDCYLEVPGGTQLNPGKADFSISAWILVPENLDDVPGEAFAKAEVVFQNDVQTKNRMFYLLGIAVGLIAIGVLAGSVLGVAHWLTLTDLARPEMVIDLFAFAGLGSLTSVLARLSTIDLKDELRRKWVLISAAVRPIMAVAFAAIAYLVLTYELVKFSGFDTPDQKKALIWIAAFLCGYSERFAQDLLDRLPFTTSDEGSASS